MREKVTYPTLFAYGEKKMGALKNTEWRRRMITDKFFNSC